MSWLTDIFENSSSFMPHGHCYLWLPGLLWLHVVSDLLIGLAYIGISLVLYLMVRKLRMPFSPLFIAFGLFIGLCGVTHFMAIWTVWNPDYWSDGLIKGATAAASVATAAGLLFIRPQVENVVHAARLSEERRVQLETTLAELQLLYQKVKDMDELKTQFFANVSHELRTPLTLIMGPAERLREDANLTPEQRQQLDTISRNSKTLLKQVNDLLDVSRLEEGKMDIRYVRVDLAPAVRQLVDLFVDAARQRGIALHYSGPDRLSVEVDADKVERILINLVSNAIKFTQAGGEVRVVLTGSSEYFSLIVSDNGPGIAPAQRQAIFERFRQADGSTTRQFGGSGLGLAIAKDFAEMHGGQLELEDTATGASFRLVLPSLAPSATPVATSLQAVGTANLVAVEGAVEQLRTMESTEPSGAHNPDLPSVLVVDDSFEMRIFVANVLQSEYQVLTACDGEEGLQKAQALQPDLIVTDLMMPRMSGDQLVSQLRAQSRFDHLPVLLLTAKEDDELRVRLLESGAQDYLTKPFMPQELIVRARNLITIKRTGEALRRELDSASGNVDQLASELLIRHRQVQAALEAAEVAREQAEKASLVKTQFLAMISHEMRTPLTNLGMNAQMINRPGLDETGIRTQRERMVRAVQQLSTLIEGLLEYTRVESGRLQARPEMVDVAELISQVVDICQLQVVSPEITLRFEPPGEPRIKLYTDPRLLRVILSNLITNALKFSKKGDIVVRTGPLDHWQRFEVEDPGIGIATEDIPRIFLPFEQLEPVQRKSIPGVGLGLTLTREMVEVLGGRIEVSSEPAVGSRFTVLLPRHTEAPLADGAPGALEV